MIHMLGLSDVCFAVKWEKEDSQIQTHRFHAISHIGLIFYLNLYVNYKMYIIINTVVTLRPYCFTMIHLVIIWNQLWGQQTVI